METGNSGIIGYTENRININAMKEYYRSEYQKIVNKEKKSNSDLFHNKWKVRFGSFAARIGLSFHTKGTVKILSKLGVRLTSRIIQKAMTLKNKADKKKYQKQKDQLTADFINLEGKFKEFEIINPTTIEEIEEPELEMGFQK